MNERTLNICITVAVVTLLVAAMTMLILLTYIETAEAPTGPSIKYGVAAV